MTGSVMNQLQDYIYTYNSQNIDTILQDQEYARTLDMKTNKLCEKTKIKHPDCSDKSIQAYVLTIQQLLLLSISNNIDNAYKIIKS